MARADRIVVLAALALSAACGPTRRGDLVGPPVQPDSRRERVGERLFFRHCSYCHPGGEAGLGPALNDKPLPHVAITTQIRRGVGAMPSFPERQLTDAEVDAIAAYVIDLRQTPTTARR